MPVFSARPPAPLEDRPCCCQRPVLTRVLVLSPSHGLHACHHPQRLEHPRNIPGCSRTFLLGREPEQDFSLPLSPQRMLPSHTILPSHSPPWLRLCLPSPHSLTVTSLLCPRPSPYSPGTLLTGCKKSSLEVRRPLTTDVLKQSCVWSHRAAWSRTCSSSFQ